MFIRNFLVYLQVYSVVVHNQPFPRLQKKNKMFFADPLRIPLPHDKQATELFIWLRSHTGFWL